MYENSLNLPFRAKGVLSRPHILLKKIHILEHIYKNSVLKTKKKKYFKKDERKT